jgi:hypothetical protein
MALPIRHMTPPKHRKVHDTSTKKAHDVTTTAQKSAKEMPLQVLSTLMKDEKRRGNPLPKIGKRQESGGFQVWSAQQKQGLLQEGVGTITFGGHVSNQYKII